MSVTAYVLIQTEVGRSEKVAKASREIKGVVDSDNVAGPYDVIVKVEAPTLDDLAKVVVSELQKVEGITRTFTCPIVNLIDSVVRCGAGYLRRGRSLLNTGHSLLGGIPASRRSFLNTGHSLLGGIPASRRSFLNTGHSLLGGCTRLTTRSANTGPRCSAGYPPTRSLRATRLAPPRAPHCLRVASGFSASPRVGCGVRGGRGRARSTGR